MIKLGNWIWEGLSTDTKPTKPSALNGHMFKELDTGKSYTLISGVWQPINLGLDPVNTTKSGIVVSNANGESTVTFNSPYIDTNYSISLSPILTSNPKIAAASNISTTGFKVTVYRAKTEAIAPSVTIHWVTTRHYNP